MANTDAQALQQSRAGNKLQLGARVTEGLGAGARPEVGAAAAEELIEEIVERLSGCHMCFITAGMGGGTGTGAAPIIAKAAREMGILTVGVVTKPFQFEGARRMKQAESGVEELQAHVDTLIIIPNQNLFRLANEKTTFTEAFALADDVLYQGVKGVTDLMVRPGHHQPRLRRRPLGDERDGQGDDGHRRGRRRGPRGAGGREGDRQPAARRDQPQGRQGRADQHHRRPRPHAVRARRGGQPHPRRGRSGGQHHGRLDARPGDGRHDAGVGRRHRHRRRGAVGSDAAAEARRVRAGRRPGAGRAPPPTPRRRCPSPGRAGAGADAGAELRRPPNVAEAEREQLFAEPACCRGAAAGHAQRTAPFGQPKFEADGRRRPANPRPTRCAGCRRRCRTCRRRSRWCGRSLPRRRARPSGTAG